MQQICKNPWCKQSFEVTRDDLEFYEKVSPVFAGKKELIPPPLLCPACRDQLRYAFRNERHLYRRPCALCGQLTMSIYAPENPYQILCHSCFTGDRWSADAYAKDFDFSRPFFPQFLALKLQVLRQGVDVLNNENSDYSNISIENKDCYLVFATVRSERCFYTRKIIHSTDSMDCIYGEKLQLSYECLDCNDSYHLLFSERSNNCSFSAFLFDCSGAQSCFMCSNLRNKQYCFHNEQLTKEEYEARLPDLRQSSVIEQCKEEFRALKIKSIHRESQNVQAEHCRGNYLKNCKNCTECFDLHNSEDCKYSSDAVTGAKATMDCSCVTMECEWDLECSVCSNSTSLSSFCFGCRDANSNLLYCDAVFSSKYLFGCTGLRHKQYCILNRQYTKAEYEKLVPRIIQSMRVSGEWGQFFPVNHSTFDYNESLSFEYYPRSQEQALSEGFRWRDIPDEIPKVSKVIPAAKLPDSIDDIPDDILNWAIECEATKRPFKIVRQELDFYRTMRLPVPHFHPDERHRRRMALRNPRKLRKRPCMKCGKEMETTYSPERPETVYCEVCYLKEVY